MTNLTFSLGQNNEDIILGPESHRTSKTGAGTGERVEQGMKEQTRAKVKETEGINYECTVLKRWGLGVYGQGPARTCHAKTYSRVEVTAEEVLWWHWGPRRRSMGGETQRVRIALSDRLG